MLEKNHDHFMKLTVNILIGAMTLGGIGCNNVKEFAIYDPVKKKLIYSDKPIRCNHIKLTLEDMEELGINFRNPTPEQLKNYENKCNALEKKIQEGMSDPNRGRNELLMPRNIVQEKIRACHNMYGTPYTFL